VLVEALTGIDPDRLREEKERGMTIDLGFAWMTLPSGREVSIVDVPGHERFIKNMLAGAGGIDLALLVIAADEGVMPQTREHLAILDLLGVGSGVVVLTKRDLVDHEMLAVVEADAREVIAATTLAGAPVVACSALTGEGLDDLRAVIDSQLEATEAKRDVGRPRLPIDRSFTMSGFGTVVTGTLIDGPLEVGQEVEVVPGDLRARIRGLQSHREKVERALPGSRAAVNIAGVAKDDLRRGQVLALPGTLHATNVLDVRLRALASNRRPLRHDTSLTLHVLAAEAPARLLLLDREALAPGEEGWAQLRLGEPVATVKRDRFVLRTPSDTVAGGEIVDTHPPRHKRNHPPTLDALETLRHGSPDETLLAALARIEPATIAEVIRETGLSQGEAAASVETLAKAARVVQLGDALLVTAEGCAAWSERARSEVESYHREHPSRHGMPREELRSRLRLDERVFDAALARWRGDGLLVETGATVALPGHAPSLTPAQQAEAGAYLASLAASPYAPPTDGPPSQEVVTYLEECGHIVSVGDGVAFTADAYREMVDRIADHLRREGAITLAQTRDLFGTTRKYAQALLEHLDREHVTRRVGDERVLR
jgi:selenocysteine-specific elongation factor